MPLTPKQTRFVAEYLIDLNAAAAARRAGYSARTADRTGHENLRKPEVAAAVAAAQGGRAARVQVTADDVVRELKRIAFLDPREVMTWGGDGGVKFKPSADLPEDVARCVSECSETITESGGTVRVKLASKLDALDKLARHLGLYVDRVRLETPVTAEVVEELVDAPRGDRPADRPPPPGPA